MDDFLRHILLAAIDGEGGVSVANVVDEVVADVVVDVVVDGVSEKVVDGVDGVLGDGNEDAISNCDPSSDAASTCTRLERLDLPTRNEHKPCRLGRTASRTLRGQDGQVKTKCSLRYVTFAARLAKQ
jgi:hypothetical protein